MNRWRALVVLSVAMAGACLAGVAAPAEWVYTVRPGDELWNIAAKYCGSPSYAARLAEHNRLGTGRLIRPGSRLSIPIAWLVRQPAEARVVAVSGVAFLVRPERARVAVDQRIQMGHRIVTEAGSVVVEFADGSLLTVAPESEVLFNILTAYGDTGMVDTNLRFYKGRSAARVQRRAAGSQFRISTPSGTAAVRGTEFRVGVAAATSFTETLEGSVGFVAGPRETPVPAGFGVVASPAGVASEPLLPAPGWTTVAGTASRSDALAWQPVPDAARYRVLVYRAEDPRAIFYQTIVGDPRFPLADLEPGAYRFRVRGISGTGLEGFEAELAITLKTAPPRLAARRELARRAALLRWPDTGTGGPYIVQLSRDGNFGAPIERRTERPELSVGDLPAGDYHWRVRDERSTFSAPAEVRVLPDATARVNASVRELRVAVAWDPVPGADGYRVQLARDPGFGEVAEDKLVTEPAATFTVARPGAYHVRVITEENGLQSDPVVQQVAVLRKPLWWLVGLFTLPLLAL